MLLIAHLLLTLLLDLPADLHLEVQVPRHLMFLAALHLLHLVDRLPLVRVMSLLEAQVLLHLEPLAALLVTLLLACHHPAQVLRLAAPPVAHLLSCHLPALVLHQVAHQVLPQVVPLAHHLRIPQVEAQVRRQVTCLPPALVSLHLEVFTLVLHHPTVLL